MKVILRDDVAGLGLQGAEKNVSEGYARNFLIPKGLALPLTDRNKNILETEKKLNAKKFEKEKREASLVAGKLSKITCTITVQAGEEDKIFGSVSTMQIAEELKNQGFEIDRKKIVLDEPIKHLGSFEIPVKIHSDIVANLKVQVVKK